MEETPRLECVHCLGAAGNGLFQSIITTDIVGENGEQDLKVRFVCDCGKESQLVVQTRLEGTFLVWQPAEEFRRKVVAVPAAEPKAEESNQ